jgi:myosin heavy subunit
VITIEAVMLVLLGFCIAALFVFLAAPFYSRRAARLATDELRRSMPLTESEIRADKDRLRAEFAITIHKLEAKAEQSALSAARHMVDLNRRDATISSLQGEVERMGTFLDEHENARRVLEQTITERLPRVEHRLSEAKKLLFQRDRELAHLTDSSNKQAQALEEAKQINAQQRDEVHRLNATLATRAARNREALVDPRFDGEVALRAEIEALRSKTREQSELISRLQGVMTKQGVTEDRMPSKDRIDSGALADLSAPEAEINRLRRELADAETTMRSIRGAAEAGQAGQSLLEKELHSLKAIKQDQAAEIANLRASLNVFQSAADDDKAISESKVALKARLSALQAKADEQVNTIQTLRAEIAAANEKLARQAAHFMDEMRRLGAGTLPTGGPQRRTSYDVKRPTLADRISAPRPFAANDQAGSETAADTAATEAPSAFGVREPAKPAEPAATADSFMRKLEPATAVGTAPAANSDPAPAGSSSENAQAEPPGAQGRRPGLLERITRMEKGSGAA